MDDDILHKLKTFKQNSPYLSVIVTAIIASVIGITIQYLMNGDFIGSGFYTTVMIVLVLLIRTWLQKRRNKQ